MTTRRRYWENADAMTIEFFGLQVDEQGRAYDLEQVYSEQEQAEIKRAQASTAAHETPDHIKAQLGILY